MPFDFERALQQALQPINTLAAGKLALAQQQGQQQIALAQQQIAREQQLADAEAQRTFTSNEALKHRNFTAGEAVKQREHADVQADLGRSQQSGMTERTLQHQDEAALATHQRRIEDHERKRKEDFITEATENEIPLSLFFEGGRVPEKIPEEAIASLKGEIQKVHINRANEAFKKINDVTLKVQSLMASSDSEKEAQAKAAALQKLAQSPDLIGAVDSSVLRAFQGNPSQENYLAMLASAAKTGFGEASHKKNAFIVQNAFNAEVDKLKASPEFRNAMSVTKVAMFKRYAAEMEMLEMGARKSLTKINDWTKIQIPEPPVEIEKTPGGDGAGGGVNGVMDKKGGAVGADPNPNDEDPDPFGTGRIRLATPEARAAEEASKPTELDALKAGALEALGPDGIRKYLPDPYFSNIAGPAGIPIPGIAGDYLRDKAGIALKAARDWFNSPVGSGGSSAQQAPSQQPAPSVPIGAPAGDPRPAPLRQQLPVEPQVNWRDLFPQGGGANPLTPRVKPSAMMRQPGPEHFERAFGTSDISLGKEEIPKMMALAQRDGLTPAQIDSVRQKALAGDPAALRMLFSYRDRARQSEAASVFQSAPPVAFA